VEPARPREEWTGTEPERPGAAHDGAGNGDGPGIDAHLAKSAAGVRRLTPEETVAAARRGALVVDTRTETQRREQGELPGAVVIDRTVLEWRLDPASGACIPEATGYDVEIVVVCRQGYSSILAAASLRAVGLWRSTDVIGGVEAWQAAGLPLTTGPADVRP
jgi:rhodanese-related sulfurtransferase